MTDFSLPQKAKPLSLLTWISFFLPIGVDEEHLQLPIQLKLQAYVCQVQKTHKIFVEKTFKNEALISFVQKIEVTIIFASKSFNFCLPQTATNSSLHTVEFLRKISHWFFTKTNNLYKNVN